MNDYLALFLAGVLTGAGITIQILLIPDIVSSVRLIRFYLTTHDRRRAVELFEADAASRIRRRFPVKQN